MQVTETSELSTSPLTPLRPLPTGTTSPGLRPPPACDEAPQCLEGAVFEQGRGRPP